MKHIKRLLALTLCAGLLLALTACASKDEREIKTTLSNFESACQELDTEALLDCINPTVADVLRTGGDLLSLVGIDSSAAITSVASTIFGSDYADSAFLSSLHLKTLEIDIDGDEAVALCSLTYELDEEEQQQDVEIELEHTVNDGEAGWFIIDIDFHWL